MLQHPIQRYWCVTCTAADESAHSNNDMNSSKSLGTSASGSWSCTENLSSSTSSCQVSLWQAEQRFASTWGWGQGAVSSKWWEGMAQSGSNAKIIHAGRWISTCLKEKQKTDHPYSKRFSHDTKDRGSSHEYTTPWLFCEYKACTCPWEASAKSSDIRERDKPVTHTPITTRSGCQVRRPQKLIKPF